MTSKTHNWMPAISVIFFYFPFTFLLISPSLGLSQEFVEVYNEPFHNIIFENENYRVLDVHLHKGDTSLFHSHSTPIAYITIQGTRMWLQEFNKEPRIIKLPNNWVGSNRYSRSEPFVHRIAVAGKESLKLIAVERKQDKQSQITFHDSLLVHSENDFKVFKLNPQHLKIQNTVSDDLILILGNDSIEYNNERLLPGSVISKSDQIIGATSNVTIFAVAFSKADN